MTLKFSPKLRLRLIFFVHVAKFPLVSKLVFLQMCQVGKRSVYVYQQSIHPSDLLNNYIFFDEMSEDSPVTTADCTLVRKFKYRNRNNIIALHT